MTPTPLQAPKDEMDVLLHRDFVGFANQDAGADDAGGVSVSTSTLARGRVMITMSFAPVF